MLGGDGLGCRLREDEQDDGDADGGEENALLAPEGDGQGGGQGCRSGIDQVGAQQDGGEESLRALDQPGDAPGSPYPGADQMLELDSLQGEEGCLRAAKEGGKHQTGGEER
jgi:hypothetical protein